MHILFVDSIPWDYTVDSAWERPLGGTQSGVCYLSTALARTGARVTLLNGCSQAAESRGVWCRPLRSHASPAALAALSPDIVVVVNSGRNGLILRQALGQGPRIICWTGHATDQPAMEHLRDPAFTGAFDGFAFVGTWQRDRYIETFHLPPDRCRVLGNAVAPAFEDVFAPGEAILPSKDRPPVLAYTTTPFRGLDLLVQAIPVLRRTFPDLQARIWSSMKVYNHPANQEERDFGDLYRRCRSTPGMDLRGSIPQPHLARELRHVAILAYPNTYPETSCIAVMEAMAAGCVVVTAARAALPETTAGFGELVPPLGSTPAFLSTFTKRLTNVIRDLDGMEEHLQRQVAFVRKHYTWDVRAREWMTWLAEA